MKVFLAVIICKILYFIGKQIGRGSSLPGKVVLRIFPDILQRMKLPGTIIAVTGSNGKTTTTELIVQILKANGMSTGWNHEGSNQTEGVATLLLRVATLSGKVNRDAIVMECDERYARKIFEKVKPTAILVTNLCRDQLTRNGHPEFIEDCIRASIEAAGDGAKLVLNADDPYVAALATPQNEVLWFAVKQGEKQGDGSSASPSENNGYRHIGMYDDGAFCPVCKERMTYKYRIAGHYGSYNCNACGLKRNDPEVEVAMQYSQEPSHSSLIFNTGEKMSIKLPSITGAYNFCAAVAIAKASGINAPDSVRALDGYELTGGRTIKLELKSGESKDEEKREGLLLLSKHENSFAYDASLTWIVEQKKPCTVIVLVDAISRKYYTSETSWFWDIDFDLLADTNIKNIVLAGRYINELAARFVMSAVDQAKIGYVADLIELRGYIETKTTGDIYVLTCFSDKAKLLKAFE